MLNRAHYYRAHLPKREQHLKQNIVAQKKTALAFYFPLGILPTICSEMSMPST